MQLVIQTGPKAGEQYDLGGKPLILGNDPESEISVPDSTLAERHARFENIGGAIFVADLESTNGTFLNGQRMNPGARYPLRPDDTLQIGSTVFKIQESIPVAAPAPAVSGSGDQATQAQPSLQPYQYQISTTYSAPPPAAPVATPQVQKTKRKIHWPSVISALVVVIALNASVIYFINSNTSTTLEISNSGQATRVQGRATAAPRPPTPTPDQSGALFKGPTPGIGGNTTPSTPVQLGTGDVPYYPGARRIDNPTGAVFFTQYITSDSFDKLSEWARTAFADKGWTKIEVKSLPGKEGAVLTGVKGKMSLVTYLLGPAQKDTAPYNNYFKSANVDPNEAVVVINITVS